MFCSIYIINIIRVNGVIYKEIVSGEKLLADILPPPGYIIETHRYIQSINNSMTIVSKDEYLKQIELFEKEYNLTLIKWKNSDEKLLKLFNESNYYVHEYYEEAKKVLLEKEIKNKVIISLEKMYKLDKLFLQHRNAIENIIKYQKEKNLKKNQEAAEKIKLIIVLTAAAVMFILAALIVMGIYFSRKIICYHNAEKELMAEKDRFYSVISHDLRGPIGNISELLKNIDEFQDKEKELIIEELKKISQKTFILLDDLLEWSKLQQNKTEKQECSVGKAILETAEFFSEIAAQKNIVIKSEIDEFDIEINERIFKTVLRNLISNAIKYTKKEGEIVLKSERDKFKYRIIVKDNGVGMSPERVKEIKSKKVVVSSFGTEKEVGSGFGLSLCRDIIEKIGGELKINSEKGYGTEVIIEFKTK